VILLERLLLIALYGERDSPATAAPASSAPRDEGGVDFRWLARCRFCCRIGEGGEISAKYRE